MSNKPEMIVEKQCWACKRIITGGVKFGLCSKCLNKYGTPVAAAAALGISFGARELIKNGSKIVKGAVNLLKNFKS